MLDLFCTQPWKIMPCLGRMHLGRHAILKLSCFPRQNRWKKRGIAIIPTKFGISFTVPFLNQVGKHPIFLLRQPMGRWRPSSYQNRIPMLHVFANFGNWFFFIEIAPNLYSYIRTDSIWTSKWLDVSWGQQLSLWSHFPKCWTKTFSFLVDVKDTATCPRWHYTSTNVRTACSIISDSSRLEAWYSHFCLPIPRCCSRPKLLLLYLLAKGTGSLCLLIIHKLMASWFV